MSPRKPDPELLKLQQEWDQRLRDAGFVDHEDRLTGLLNTWAGSSGRCYTAQLAGKSSKQSKLDRQEYFRLAGHFLHDHTFTSTIDQVAWEGHSEGQTHGAIAKTLGVPVQRVKRVISRLAAIMLGRPVPQWVSGHKKASRSDQGKK